MNECAMLHIPDSQYCFPINNETVILRFRTMRDEKIDSISVIYACKYEFASTRNVALMEKKYSDRLYDYYEVTLSITDVRLAYIFEIKTSIQTFYYSEDGLTTSYNYQLGFYNFFQLPYIHPIDTVNTIEWMNGAVFYQIFIDRFFRGDSEKDDSYINLEWGEIPNPKSFAGGDLKGIIQKLDYLKNLSINTIYLTPIFNSVSNHKYDISDYYMVDKQFGTNQDFKKLVKKAHDLGIKIVLDAVFNHSSQLLPQFQDVLKKGKDSPYYNWFLIEGDYPVPEEENYACFASCYYMPKLNSDNLDVTNFLLDIACHWINEYDIDGWRLDVADEISHDFWRKFRKAVKEVKKECVIIGENWHDAGTFLFGDQYDSIMNYGFTKAALDFFAFDALDAEGFASQLNKILMRNKKQVNDMMLNLLDSHDTHRFYSEVKNNKNKVLGAMTIAVCFPGAPCVYYGTEICTEGGYDPDSRRTFDWNNENWDIEFMDKFKSILSLKQQLPLQGGDVSVFAKDNVFAIIRKTNEEKVVLLYNGDTTKKSIYNLLQQIDEKSNREIIVSNLYEQEVLQPEGFIAYKQKGI